MSYRPIFAGDDKQLYVTRRSFSGGINTRQSADRISETQCENLENMDIGVVGEIRKTPGLTLIQDLGNNAGTGMFGFEPRGGTNELIINTATAIKWWNGVGSSFASIASLSSTFSFSLDCTMIKAGETGDHAGDVVLLSNGTDNVLRLNQVPEFQDLGDTTNSPPKSTVMTYFRNRPWFLKANALYWGDALPVFNASMAGFATAFDRVTNYYNMPVGTERALLSLRDTGLIAIGQDAVYGINPSTTPAATDKPEKILDIGCIAGNTACQVGDDVYYLAADGVRGLFRTQQDKVQGGAAYPISFPLKDNYDTISWAYISKACAVYFDNKYFISLPVNASTYNNEVWVFYPALQAWIVITGWNVGKWAKMKVSGEEQLYAYDSNDGSVYQAWKGTTNNGTAVSAEFISRQEDGGQPLVYKNGGELEIETEVADADSTLTLSISVDGSSFQALATIDISSSNAPELPVTLPFTLADKYVVRNKVHLDSIGRWRTFQLKITNAQANTEPIIIYGYSLVAFAEEYESE